MHPRRIEDLRCPHILEKEKPYKICARVKLGTLDYENFLNDMLADRKFIEDNFSACAAAPEGCILVQQAGSDDGVLLIPEHGSYVKMAAYLYKTGEENA